MVFGILTDTVLIGNSTDTLECLYDVYLMIGILDAISAMKTSTTTNPSQKTCYLICKKKSPHIKSQNKACSFPPTCARGGT